MTSHREETVAGVQMPEFVEVVAMTRLEVIQKISKD